MGDTTRIDVPIRKDPMKFTKNTPKDKVVVVAVLLYDCALLTRDFMARKQASMVMKQQQRDLVQETAAECP